MIRRANAPSPAGTFRHIPDRDRSRGPDRHPRLCRGGRDIARHLRPRVRRGHGRDGVLVQDSYEAVAVGEDPARCRGARHLRLLRPPDDQRGPPRPADLDRGPTHRPVRLGAGHSLLRRAGKTGPALLTRRRGRAPHSRGGPSGLRGIPRLPGNLARSLPRRARVLMAFDDGRSRSPCTGLARDHGPCDRACRCRVPGLPAGTPSRSGDHSAVLAHLVPSPPRSQWCHRDRGPVDRACPGRQGEREDRGRRLPRLRERARHRHPQARSATRSSCECEQTGPATSSG